MSLILSFLLSLTAILLSYVYYQRVRQFRIFQRLGIPGPPPSFFTGNLEDIRGTDRNPMETMANWEALYGPFYGYFAGTRPMLVVRELELLKEILVRNSKSFIDRPHNSINPFPLPQTLTGLQGKRWKEVRAMLSPTFSSAKMKPMLPLMVECLDTTLSILNSKSKSKIDSLPEEIDAYKLFQGLTCDVISGCALAMKVNAQTDENDPFLASIKGFLSTAINPFIKLALCFPLVAFLAQWGLTTFGYSHEMTQMIIDNVKAAIQLRRGDGHRRVDVLQLMLDAGETSDIVPGRETMKLTDDEIVANAWVFILGGFETTAANLSFTAYLLSRDEEVQERLYEEVRRLFGEDEIPSYEQLNDLKYLDQVISESLRLYPPVVSFVIRRVEQDVELGGFKIPRGMNIQVPVWQIHRDPNLWPNPESFDPERFNQQAKKSHHSMAWIPFGAGPRSCIGARFAQLETKLTLARLVRKFKILRPENSTEKLKLMVPTVSLVPVGGIPLKFQKRNS